MPPWTIEQNGPTVTIQMVAESVNWEQWALLTSDRHHDSPHCNRVLERRHLEEARERNAFICDFGDLFDAMQGKFDPRRNLGDVRPEDKTPAYYDSIVKHAAEDYGAYADLFALISKGNHETAVIDKANTDLIQRLVTRLNGDYGGNVKVGGYGGWVIFRVTRGVNNRTSKSLKYHHGAGGGGPVTRGVIQTNRQAVYLPDADIVVNGHTHDAWHVPIKRERIDQRGEVYFDTVHFLRTPGYKDGYRDGSSGFEIEKWQPPKSQGCAWLRFRIEDQPKFRMIVTPFVDVE